MGFAPLWIPFNRRVETFAVIIGVWIGFLAHVTGAFCWLVLFFTPLWPLCLIYATFVYFFDSHRPMIGGRRIEWFRKLTVWKYFCNYFPCNIVKTAYLDKRRNYIFGFHPHGIISVGAFGNFATEGSDFSVKFPGIKPHVLTLRIMFMFPFCRDLMMAFGFCDVSKKSIEYICGKEEGGNAAIIVVGGAAESLDARPGSCSVTLKDRKGFIRMALKTGADLVPVFSFGENELYKQAENPHGSRLRGFQERARKLLSFAPVVFYGRGIFQYNFGFLPFRRKITTVVGAPIPVTKRVEPTMGEVKRLHELYMKRLKELFDRYKGEYSDYHEASLEIK